MDEADRCDELLFMRDGHVLAQGAPGELRARAGTDNLETAFLSFATGSGASPTGSAGGSDGSADASGTKGTAR
jgi:ABC-2 type transport system ATP-binding protein